MAEEAEDRIIEFGRLYASMAGSSGNESVRGDTPARVLVLGRVGRRAGESNESDKLPVGNGRVKQSS